MRNSTLNITDMDNISSHRHFLKDVVIEGIYNKANPYGYTAYGHLLKIEMTDEGLFFDFDYLWIYQKSELQTNVRLKMVSDFSLYYNCTEDKCVSENHIIDDFIKIVNEKCNVKLNNRHLKSRRKIVLRHYHILDIKQKLPDILKYSGLLYHFSDDELKKITDFTTKLL